MGIRIGPWDPLKLTFSILNGLMKKGVINAQQAKEILMDALPDDMPEDEKKKIVDSMVMENGS